MFIINCTNQKYAYDVHSLTKAFYPDKQLKMLTPETKKEEYDELAKQAQIVFMIDDLDHTEDGSLGNTGIYFMENGISEYHPKIQGDFYQEKDDVDENVILDAFGNIFGGNQAKHQYEISKKNQLKKFLYEALCDHTGKSLPWGNLTGIRPTKLVMQHIEAGWSDRQIRDFLREVHMVSEEKIALAMDIAHREKKLLSDLHYEDGYSLYIGIPFCPTTCLYCSFTSYPICSYREKVDAYVDCLIEEMKQSAQIMEGKVLDTVYIGGGTPTTLESYQLEKLITSLKEIYDFSTVKEFTVEAGRADSITREKLETLYKLGVTRISVNPQTMNEQTLRFIGRQATAAQTVESYKLAREVGFDNINMDIILGLPGEEEKEVTDTIEKIVSLQPDSLTVHSLAIKRASKLRQYIEKNGMSELTGSDAVMDIAAEGAGKMQMQPYYLYRQKKMSGNLENVGFAKEGKYGIYNILIMEEVQTIVALGAGSITKRVYPDGRIERCDNVKDVNLYMQQLEEMIERKRQLFSTTE